MNKRSTLLISCLLAIGIIQTAAARLYRWVDADGKVHYTDSLPPDQVRRGHDELDRRGITVRRVERAKTAEEIAAEKRIERLRKEQQKLIEKQKAEDRVLLRTFRSVDDIKLTRDGKIATIDSMIAVDRGNIKRTKRRLEQMQDHAAQIEKRGQTVSKRYLANIAQLRDEIRNTYAAILRRERSKDEIFKRYARDIERFKKIARLRQQTTEKEKDLRNVWLDNIAHCPNAHECARRWRGIEDFVRKYSTTPIQILGDRIVSTKTPKRGTDISLTVSRIREKGKPGDTLFLDIQCRNTLSGQELCASDKAAMIKKKFRETFGDPPAPAQRKKTRHGQQRR